MSKSSEFTRRTAIRVAIVGAAAVATGAARAPRHEAGDMERVLGIGGFFFRAKDPKKLAGWYEANLGVPSMPNNWRTSAGTTVLAPFKEDTSYFGDRRFQWMNQLPCPRPRQDGRPASRTSHHGRIGLSVYPNGRFARLSDPEGNPNPTLATRRLGSRLRP